MHILPIETTRTSSPYSSPNSAIWPCSIARSGVIRRVATSALARMRSFTSDFDHPNILVSQRFRMTEIEAQPVGGDERALLRDMGAEPTPQRLMNRWVTE